MINLTIFVVKIIQDPKEKLILKILLKTIIKIISCCKDPIQSLIKVLKLERPEIYRLLIVYLHLKCDLQLPNLSISSKKVNYLLTTLHLWAENPQNLLIHYKTKTKKWALKRMILKWKLVFTTWRTMEVWLTIPSSITKNEMVQTTFRVRAVDSERKEGMETHSRQNQSQCKTRDSNRKRYTRMTSYHD